MYDIKEKTNIGSVGGFEMKKRLLAALMAGAMALSLVACGSSSSTETATTTTTTESTTTESTTAESTDYKIALCMSHQTNSFTTAVSKGANEMAEQLGVTVDVFDGKQDQATQTSQIEQIINSGYDGILVEPISVDGIVPAIKQANEAGVPVITVVQNMTDADKYVEAYVGGDDALAGELQMQKVAEALGGEGKIAILYGPMGSDAQLIRKSGYDIVLAEYPGIEVVFEETANWVTEEALTLVENWLTTGTEINAIVGQNDSMAMGAVKAVEDAGMEDEIIVYGIDAVEDAIAAVADERLDGTISQDAAGQGALGVQKMVEFLNGATLDAVIQTECIWVDTSNVADYQ